MRQLLAALGVFVLAGSAAAQYPSPAAMAGTPIGPGPGAFRMQNIDKHTAAGGYFTTNAAYGDAYTNNAAGSVYSDHAFAFGSTRSFFAPCGPYIGGMCKPLFGRKQNCPPAPCEGK